MRISNVKRLIIYTGDKRYLPEDIRDGDFKYEELPESKRSPEIQIDFATGLVFKISKYLHRKYCIFTNSQLILDTIAYHVLIGKMRDEFEGSTKEIGLEPGVFDIIDTRRGSLLKDGILVHNLFSLAEDSHKRVLELKKIYEEKVIQSKKRKYGNRKSNSGDSKKRKPYTGKSCFENMYDC